MGGGGGGGGGGPTYSKGDLLRFRAGRIGQREQATCAIAELNFLEVGKSAADLLAESISLEHHETRNGDVVRKLACGRTACPAVCELMTTTDGEYKDSIVTAEYDYRQCLEGYPIQ